MTKRKVKARGSGTLDLTIGKRYRPVDRNIFDTGGNQRIPKVNNSISGAGSIKTMNASQASAAGLTPAKTGISTSSGSAGNAGSASWSVPDVMGTVSSVLGGVTGLVQGFTSGNQIGDTSGMRESIEDTAGTDFSSASDFQSLADMYSNMDWQDTDYGMWDVRGASRGQLAGNVISSAAQGAMAGMAAGPWTALAGGVAGLGAGLAGVFTGNAKARREAEELNRLAERANNIARSNYMKSFDRLSDEQTEGLLSNIAAEGGKIHIKPSKRGTFTAAAKRHGKSVQAFASQVLANRENYSPAMVKKANFARNASKWKHGDGGNLYTDIPDWRTHGGNFSNGLVFIDEGGTHEQNPYDGVQMGVDQQGVPNLVEEGEVIYNDYVFSNRLAPRKDELRSADLSPRYSDWTFAKIAEDIGKESSERPNDPISRRSLDALLSRLSELQEMKRTEKGKKGTQQLMAYGGRRYAGTVDTAGAAGQPALPAIDTSGIVIEDIPVDITDTGVSVDPYRFFVPRVSRKGSARRNGVWVDSRGNVAGRSSLNPHDAEDNGLQTWMRYAPVAGSAVGALTSLLRKPDYDSSDILLNEASSLSRQGVRFRPLHNYMRYNPVDRNYLLNRIGTQAGATRRAILNASAGNSGAAMAGLLAAGRQAQEAAGDALMKMDQYNDAQRKQVQEFNRGTDQYNSQGLMQADAQNAQLAQNRDRLRSTLLSQAAQMREASRSALEASRSANLTNLFDNIGMIGRENRDTDMLESMKDSELFGVLNEAMRRGWRKDGGMLTRKGKRRKR